MKINKLGLALSIAGIIGGIFMIALNPIRSPVLLGGLALFMSSAFIGIQLSITTRKEEQNEGK